MDHCAEFTNIKFSHIFYIQYKKGNKSYHMKVRNLIIELFSFCALIKR